MNFLPASVRGTVLDTPLGRFDLGDERKAAAIGDRELVLVGIRPEAFEDASLVSPDKRTAGSVLRARIDVTEWLGNELYAYVPYEAPEDVRQRLRDLSRELDSDQLRTQAVVALDPSSRILDGQEAELWVNTATVHIFDPASGENLTRDERRATELGREADQRGAEQRRAQRGAGPLGGPQPDATAG
jgi:multiple sugar transport system ATP-binding protein